MASRNCKVVIHVDAKTSDSDYKELVSQFKKNTHVAFADRIRCEWGRFSLVRAGLGAAQMLLKRWPNITHVAQISGACVPLKPVNELIEFLDAHPDQDFVESVPAASGAWVKDGLCEERFTLYFPFSWKTQRFLFDLAVELQRKLKIHRKPPGGLIPHVGSQWWCLSAATLKKILADPERESLERYFSRCWIPDEGYFPTVVRRHSNSIACRSLTLSRFDDQGKPHLFYDDHSDLLAQTDHFFARKIWHGADKLYRRFTGKIKPGRQRAVSDDLGLEVLFSAAEQRRCKGRPGRVNAGRFPAAAHESQPATCREYAVFFGHTHLFDGFENWVGMTTGLVSHGRLFKSNEVQFAENRNNYCGAIPDNPRIRDTNPEQFFCNILWNGRTRKHSVMVDFADGARISAFFANDPNATLFVLKNSWLLDLFQRKNTDFAKTVRQALRLHRIEQDFFNEIPLDQMTNLHIFSLSNYVSQKSERLAEIQQILTPEIDLRPSVRVEFRNLSGFRDFVHALGLAGVPVPNPDDLSDVLPGEDRWKPTKTASAAG